MSVTSPLRRFRDALNVRLRWPRVTTRRLMVLVAIVAIVIWGYRDVPRMIDRTMLCQGHANAQAAAERDFRELSRESRARAAAIRSELDRMRNHAESPDSLTERYYESRLESESLNIKYCEFMAGFHESSKRRFLRARWFPWSPVPLNVVPPRDPFATSPEDRAPGGFYEWIEGGIAIAFSPKGETLAVGCRDRTIKFLELPSRRVLSSFSPSESDDLGSSFFPDLAFSRDGTTLHAVSGSHPLWRWDVASGQPRRALPWIVRSPGQTGPFPTATSMDCSPKEEMIAIASDRTPRNSSTPLYTITLLDARTGASKWEVKGSGAWIHSVAFSPDGQTLACGGGTAMLRDTRTGQLKATLKPAIGSVMTLAFSPDGRTLAGAGSNMANLGDFNGSGRVTLWDIPTGRILRTLEGPTGRATNVAFSPAGQTIAAGGEGPSRKRWDKRGRLFTSEPVGEVMLWEAATGKPVWTAEGVSPVGSLAFSADGKSLAYCDVEYVYFSDAHTGKLRQIVMDSVGRYRPHRSRNRVPGKGGGRDGAR